MVESRQWDIVLTREAEKSLRRLPRTLLQRIDRVLAQLSENPTPLDCKRLTGYPNLYRVRVGGGRIVYTLEHDRLVVLVIRIAPRGEVYRNL